MPGAESRSTVSWLIQNTAKNGPLSLRQRPAKAGADGSRTHQGRLCATPHTVLKTGEPTGTQPPPRVLSILGLRLFVKQPDQLSVLRRAQDARRALSLGGPHPARDLQRSQSTAPDQQDEEELDGRSRRAHWVLRVHDVLSRQNQHP